MKGRRRQDQHSSNLSNMIRELPQHRRVLKKAEICITQFRMHGVEKRKTSFIAHISIPSTQIQLFSRFVRQNIAEAPFVSRFKQKLLERFSIIYSVKRRRNPRIHSNKLYVRI